MKIRPFLLALGLLTLTASSCITLTLATVATTTAYALAKQNTRLKGKTIRGINEKAALLETKAGEVVCIVCLFDGYHDGMKISGKFRQGGVYEYKDDEGVTRRVPIYVQSKHIPELVDTAIGLDYRSQEKQESPVYQI